MCQRKTQEETIADFHKALLRAYTADIPSLIEATTRARFYDP